MSKPEVVSVLVDIARRFDVLAIQELRDKEETTIPEFIRLMNRDGANYRAAVSRRIGYVDVTSKRKYEEQLVYIYDANRVEIISQPYYNPTTNEITFPAAILQPPFFDPEAEDAANYGTMGSIIGHELSHGFDDQGSQFDADGNMKMWWTEQDFKNFTEKKQGIVTQFDAYVAIDTLHVNGQMTQGENIADLGGLTMAFSAYQKSLNGKPSKEIDGFTGEQRFFIAWAQGWKQICRDTELKRLLTVDYHSPAYFRAFAPLTNIQEFYKAFNVKEGDKMFTPPANRVEIW
jgi:endothelin-converting enzyme